MKLIAFILTSLCIYSMSAQAMDELQLNRFSCATETPGQLYVVKTYNLTGKKMGGSLVVDYMEFYERNVQSIGLGIICHGSPTAGWWNDYQLLCPPFNGNGQMGHVTLSWKYDSEYNKHYKLDIQDFTALPGSTTYECEMIYDHENTTKP